MDKAKEIIEMAKPISKILQTKYHPHMSVIIQSDNIRVEETIAGEPIELYDKENDF